MSFQSFKLFSFLICLFLFQSLSAQTVLWQEDFSGAPPAPGWNDTNFTDCDGTPQSFNGVNMGRYEITDMEGAPCCPGSGGGNDNEWVTNDINIAGYCNVTITIDYGSVGTFECVAGGPFFGCTGNVAIDNGHDQIVFEYSINGGGWVQFQYVCGSAPPGPATVAGLSGNTIRIRIRPANKATAETYWFDNVKITGVQPTVDPVNDISGCAGSAIMVNFTGTGSPAPTFSWTNDNTAIGLGASGTGNINFTPPVGLANQEIANITVTPMSAGCSGTPETFTITVNPLPLTDDPADVVACAGDFVDIHFTGDDPNATYHWTVANVPFFPPSGVGDISGTVPSFIPFHVTGTVTVHAESNGCVGPNQSFQVDIYPAISATFTMITPADICAGQPATFSVNFSGGTAPYTFTYAIDGVQQPPLTTNNDPFNFNVTLAADATISAVQMTSSVGCVQDVTGSFDVHIIPTPVATLAPGPTNICAGSSVDLQIDFNGTDDYSFVYTINGVAQPSITATGPSTTITVNPPVGTTTYTLVSVNNMGCTGTASGTHVVNVTALPTAIITGNPVICAGQNATIPITLGGSAPWTIVYSINGVEEPPVTANSSPYFITQAFSSSSTLELVSVSTGNCAGTVSGIAFVTVQPGVTGVLTSDTTAVCIGGSDTLHFSFTGTAPYNFIYTVNGMPQPQITTSNNTYQIGVTPAVTTTYTLTSVSNGSCPGGSASGTYLVNIANPPTAVISGTDTICAEHSAPLSINFTGTAPWTFSYAVNGIPKDTITTSLNPYILTVSPNATTTYSLTGVQSGNCSGSVSGSATIKIIPNPTVTLTGGGQICQNGSGTDLIFTFTGTAPWTVTYKANNDTLTATSSISPLVLPVNPNIGTIYKLLEVSDSLCTDTAVGQVIVFVFTPANAQFLGSASFCDSADTQVLIDFTGTGPFTINYTINGVAQQPDTTFDDPYVIPVHVNTTTTFELTSIESPGCTGIITGSPAVISVNYAPTYTNLNLNCNFAAGTYVVTFDVLGAKLPLTAVGGNGGTFSGSQWTSNPIPLASGYSFTFHDANNCGNVSVTGANTCTCVTEAGTMSLAPITACESQVINAAYNGGFVNDGNDTLLYILHSNPTLPLGTIYGWNNIPSFGFQPGMTAGVTYYISAIAGNISAGLVDLNHLCTVVSQGTPVVFHAQPVADLGISNPDICLGDSLTLTVNFSGSAPFSFTPAIGGVPQSSISGINNSTYSWTVGPIASTVYTINAVTDQFCPNGQGLGTASVTVSQPPMVSNVQTHCDYSTATYTVTFDIVSGTPPFNLSGLVGFFAGPSFTSLPIPFAASTYFATLSDGNNCGQDTISGLSNCNCTGNAGTMSQTQVKACANTTLTVPATQNPVLDSDDILLYILHTNPGIPEGIILAWSTTPSFTFAGPMQTGVTYYVSAVVGNPGANGTIDLLDPCLSIATGTPVQWIPTPTATLASNNYNICPGNSQSLLVNLTGTQPFMLSYTNNGNPFSVTATQTAFLLNATLQQTATFILTSVTDATSCTGTVSGSAIVNVHPAPAAANFISNCSPATQTYTIEFDITQGDLSTITIANLTGNYNPLTGHFISDPIPSGQSYSVLIKDSWNCGSFTYTDLVNCACTTAAGVMDPSPLTPCNGQTVTTSAASGFNLEPGDALVYLLVSQSNLPPNWTIIASSATPSFAFNPATMTSSTPYFIVAVAGNAGGPNGVDLNDPCLSVSPGPTVMWRPPVTAILSGAPVVCPGSSATIDIQLSGDGPFNFAYTDGITPQSLSNISQNPYSILVSPATSTGYNLVNVSGAGNCPGTISGTASVTISNPPQALNVMVNCDLSTETYTLSFDIGNGAQPNPSYTVLGVTGTLTDTSFTSISYPGTQPYTVIIGNPTGCTSTLSGMPSCVCATDAGTLSNGVNACLPSGMVSAQLSGNQSLDPNDAVTYILCTNPAILPLGILAQSNQPQFSFQAGMTAGITYYIVAVAGNAVGGSVDLSDPCLSISPGVPVVFNFAPAALIVGDVTLCEGGNTSFQVQLSGVGPYQFVYAVNGVAQPQVGTPSNTFNILTNNVQQNQVFTLVSVNDANCPGTVAGQATVTVAPTPTGAIGSNISICAGDTTLLTLNLSGGTSYDVSISGSVPPIQLTGIQNGATFPVSPSATSTYTITNLTASGTNCPAMIGTGATVTTSVVNASSILSDFNGFNTSCPLTNDGSITLSPNSGIPPISAAWSNGASGLSNTNLAAGDYSVTLTDMIGCTFSSTYSIRAAPEISIDFSTDAPTCFGDTDGSITINNVIGGVGPYSLSLNQVVQQTTGNFPVTLSPIASGTQVLGVEDVNGCLSNVNADVPNALELMVNLGPDTSIHLGESVLLQANLNFAPYQSLVWTPSTFLDHPDSLFTMATPGNSTRYAILVTDSAGCTARDEIQITVDRQKRVYIPNVILPSSSGLNDFITVFGGQEVAKVRSMRIYDRWGELLFENLNFLPNDPQLGWNGKAKGQDVSPGVYVYAVEVEYVDGDSEVFAGDITVVR